MPSARLSKVVLFLAVAAGLVSCAPTDEPDEPRPLIVIGFDGGEWSVIRALWDEGRLPNLAALADRGVSADLETDYGISPVIWTTIATGRAAKEHGITDFVVPGPQGNVPVSSTVRRVPALWNLLGMVDRSVSVLGWYATWPAEAVNGTMITDNVMRTPLDERVHPPEIQPEIDLLVETARNLPDEETYPFGVALSDQRVVRDLLIERLAPEIASEGDDLLLVYFRVIDHLSHFYWKYWEPEQFEDVPADEIAERRDWIPAGYDRVDRAIGEILTAAGEVNVMVVSDHGFNAVPEQLRVFVDMDNLLERLGYLERDDEGGVDLDASLASAFGNSRASSRQTVRLNPVAGRPGDTLEPAEWQTDVTALRARLLEDLRSVRYNSGEPLLEVVAPDERPGIVKLDVLRKGFSETVSAGARTLDGVITHFESVSGGHLPDKAGVFIAAGPDIRPGTDVTGISIFDITPTVLYGLGLPVAEDFAGRPRVEMFKRSFRDVHPLQTIASWGEIGEGGLRESEADEEILEELRSLGYLD